MRLWSLHPRYLDPQGLVALWREALLARAVLRGETRGYSFDRSKVGPVRAMKQIAVTTEQVLYEWQHLLRKLARRSPGVYRQYRSVRNPECHPMFRSRPGPVESWERA
jgi:hypothetical protein